MTENRNASGQFVKAVILEGESVLGSSSSVSTGAIAPRLRRGWVKSPDDRGGDELGVLERPEMPETGEDLHLGLYEALCQLAEGRWREVEAVSATDEHDGALDGA